MKFVTSIPPAEKKEKGEFGIAKVSMINGNVKVEMKSTDGVYTIKKEDVPEYFPYKERAVILAHVTMSQDGQQMLYAAPARGDYDAKFTHIGNENEKPAPQSNQYGQSFKVIFEIIQKGWAGAKLIKWYNLQEHKEGYNSYCLFKKNEDGNLAIDGFGQKYEELCDLFRATGISEIEIPYTENPLPNIQDAILSADKKFIIGLSLNTKSNYLDVMVQENFDLDLSEDVGSEVEPTTGELLED